MTARKAADKIVAGDVLVWPSQRHEVEYVYHGRDNTVYLQFSGGVWPYSTTHVFDVAVPDVSPDKPPSGPKYEVKAETWMDRERYL